MSAPLFFSSSPSSVSSTSRNTTYYIDCKLGSKGKELLLSLISRKALYTYSCAGSKYMYVYMYYLLDGCSTSTVRARLLVHSFGVDSHLPVSRAMITICEYFTIIWITDTKKIKSGIPTSTILLHVVIASHSTIQPFNIAYYM